MKVLIFLAHPAHYHLLKNVKIDLESHNHRVLTIIKSKDILEELLVEEKIEFKNILKTEKKGESKFSILFNSIIGLLLRDLRLLRIAFKQKPDILIGTDWSIVHVGFLLRIPSIHLNEDDTKATPENKFFYPFANTLLMPSCCDSGLWRDKRIPYEGYHELAYLIPKRFKPDAEIPRRYGLGDTPYFIIRLVKLTASHDTNKKGLELDVVKKIISILKNHGKVIINSEFALHPDLERYRLALNPIHMHHLLFYAGIVICDSQTMTAETAVLGTPSLRFNDFVGKLEYLEELEHRYGLTYGIKTSEPDKLYQKVEELLAMPDLKEEWQKRRDKMLSDKIDVTAFIVWFIENYPESVKIMKENPDYQCRFK